MWHEIWQISWQEFVTCGIEALEGKKVKNILFVSLCFISVAFKYLFYY